MSISSNNSKFDKDHLSFNELGFNNVEEAVKVTPFVYFMTFIIAIGGFMYGGVISGAMLLLEKDIPMSGFQKGLVVGAILFGAMVSGIFVGILSDCIGRRVTLLLAAIIFASGSINCWNRYWIGINGSPVYIGEISQTFYRGKLVTINILMVAGGEFVSYLISILFSIPDHGWKWLFGISITPSFIQLLFIYFIPESPRFLIRRGEIDSTREILSKIYPNVPKIDDIHDTISQDASGSYKQLIRYPNLRPLIIACSLQAFQNLSGFSVTMIYGCLNRVHVLSAVPTVKHVLISGTSGTFLQNSDIFRKINLSILANQRMSKELAYAVGNGNVPWTIQGELFPLNIRGRAAGISAATNWLVSLSIAVSFLPLIDKLSIVGKYKNG
ncbi:major facilitator superfamily domain-containing protein [Gigaspora rosea]|uniref:Major facilitator superfamily domain-containing protein n=1 Tax=Gigaspora rosea TaxID=44941 RepID=A0A397W700_9GLOM|nr:major facilitator superfamily domain-containing protein [Gigaspora rosea]